MTSARGVPLPAAVLPLRTPPLPQDRALFAPLSKSRCPRVGCAGGTGARAPSDQLGQTRRALLTQEIQLLGLFEIKLPKITRIISSAKGRQLHLLGIFEIELTKITRIIGSAPGCNSSSRHLPCSCRQSSSAPGAQLVHQVDQPCLPA